MVDLAQIVYGGFGGHMAVANNLNSSFAALGLSSVTFGVTASAQEQTDCSLWKCTEYVPVTSSHPIRGRRTRRYIRSFMTQLRPRILLAHTHGLVPEFVHFSRDSSPNPIVVVREGHAIALRTWKDNLRSLWAIRHATAVVFVSHEYQNRYPLPLRTLRRNLKLAVIPNAVEVPVARPEPRTDEQAFRIGMATRLVRSKRVDLLMRSAAILQRKGIPVQVIVAGDGPERFHLEDLARSCMENSAVIFLGNVQDQALDAFYAGLDVYVHLSDGEGESNSILEAASYGLPIISGRQAGLARLLGSSPGYLEVELSVDETVDALMSLWGSRARLHELGLSNALEVRSERGTDAMAMSYLELFSHIDPDGPWSERMSWSENDRLRALGGESEGIVGA